ncbi:MAG: hypothetical protein WCJ55_01345, partial [Chloroflexales bacterium]
MRHLLIFLPGIMGSALQKDGRDIWALSGQALWQYLRTMRTVGESLQLLRIIDDDWEQDDLGDGISAVRLIEDLHSIPGLVEHAGYSVIAKRLAEYFDVTEGTVHAPREDANFFTFPYDWRRDNRASARKLQRFINQQLPRWRNWSGADDAQVILIAHSMGGLVSRYYLEALSGWRNCRALITVGTPHRGSLGVLDTLSNGIKKHFLDLSSVVRSFTSIYQLLPTYPVIEINNTYARVAEIDAITNIDRRRAEKARTQFHEVIRLAALQNRADPAYRQRTIPWVGTRQDTLQSALLSEDKLVLRYFPPPGIDTTLADGDGTVPRVSAVPPDIDGHGFERFAVERHGWLMNNDMTLEPLLDTLTQIVASGTQNLHGEPQKTGAAINLRLESLYSPDDPVLIGVRLINVVEQTQMLALRIEPVGHQAIGIARTIQASSSDTTTVALDGLTPGLYRLTIGPQLLTSRTLAP